MTIYNPLISRDMLNGVGALDNMASLNNIPIDLPFHANTGASSAASFLGQSTKPTKPQTPGFSKKPKAHKKKTTSKNGKDRPTRTRRVIPEDKRDLYIEGEPSMHDVVSGRGGRANHHGGNKPYWQLILTTRLTYKSSSNETEKTKMAIAVMKSVQDRNGRFLQRETSTGRWFKLPERVVMEKIKQALRDKYVPLWAQDGTSSPVPMATPMDIMAKEAKAPLRTPANRVLAQGGNGLRTIAPAPPVQHIARTSLGAPGDPGPGGAFGDRHSQRFSVTEALFGNGYDFSLSHSIGGGNPLASISSIGSLGLENALFRRGGPMYSLTQLSDEWAAVEALHAVSQQRPGSGDSGGKILPKNQSKPQEEMPPPTQKQPPALAPKPQPAPTAPNTMPAPGQTELKPKPATQRKRTNWGALYKNKGNKNDVAKI